MTNKKEIIKATLKALDTAETKIETMVKELCHGEPELFGSKAMRYFFENLQSLIENGQYFLFEEQEKGK